MKYRDWNEMQRKLEALYVLDNILTDPSEEYLRLIRKIEDGEKGKQLFFFGMMENNTKIP